MSLLRLPLLQTPRDAAGGAGGRRKHWTVAAARASRRNSRAVEAAARCMAAGWLGLQERDGGLACAVGSWCCNVGSRVIDEMMLMLSVQARRRRKYPPFPNSPPPSNQSADPNRAQQHGSLWEG